MDAGPSAGLTVETSVLGYAAAWAAAPILWVMDAVVLGLTTRRRMDSDQSFPGIGAVACASLLNRDHSRHGENDHCERDAGRHRAKRVDDRGCHRRREALQGEGKRVVGPDSLTGARN